MIERPAEHLRDICSHPGEPAFEQYRRLLAGRFGPTPHPRAVFVDPIVEKPHLF